MKRLTRKVAFISSLLITLPVVIESCCWNSCCGDSYSQLHYNVTDLTLSVTPFPARPPYPSLPASASLYDIAFLVDVKVAYLAYRQLNTASGFAALACSLPPDLSDQTITSILVTSDANFETGSKTISAGAPLNEFFELYRHEYPFPLDDIIGSEQLDTFFVRSDDWLSKRQTHTFTFTISLDDGRMFTLVTPPLDILQR